MLASFFSKGKAYQYYDIAPWLEPPLAKARRQREIWKTEMRARAERVSAAYREKKRKESENDRPEASQGRGH